MENRLDESVLKEPLLIIKFLLLSAIGVFMFFIPININGQSTIPVEFVITYLIENFPLFFKWYAFIIIMYGAIRPFIKKTWNRSRIDIAFTITKLIGAVMTLIYFSGRAPEAIARPDHAPFIFENLAIQVGTLIPICSIFLTFLMDYGFVDFVGRFLKPVMRTIWRTPGRTAVVAVASFMGSTAVGVMMCNDLYKQRKYSLREAILVVTGFSTVSISFFVVIAKTAGIMDHWGAYFFTALFVTFLVTAITVRIPPISKYPNTYCENQPGIPEDTIEGNLVKGAFVEALNMTKAAGPVVPRTIRNVLDSFELVFEVLPNFMSIGLIALIMVAYTKIFDYLGYIFYPLTLLLRIPEPLLAAKAAFMGLAEMFLPVLVIKDAPIVTRFILCVMSVGQVLMFSTTIPTIMASEIPVSIKELVKIWFIRTILIFLITVPIAYIIF